MGVHISETGKPTGKPPFSTGDTPMAFDVEKYTKNPFLKGEDLEEGERTVVTIKTAEEVNFPSGDTVPVLSFLELDQKLTLNKTRIKKLVEILGEDTDEWIGKKISLYQVDVQYQGKTMPGVAVAAPPRKPKGGQEPEVVFEQAKKRKPETEDGENPF
jgi:hypothetical protein